MLEPGKVFTSPRGTRVEMLETSPDRISFVRTMPPLTGGKGRAHVHGSGHETFEVREGEIGCVLDGRERVLTAGDVLKIPPGSAHENPYTLAGGTATIVQSVAPHPLSVEIYFTSWMQWLAQGKADDQDEPTLLQLMAIGKGGGRGDTWSAESPIFVQKIATAILGNIAALLGIRAAHVRR